ncbi:MAG: 4Fe-4S ferredoxin [Infirmifilum sp.]
MNLGEHLAYKRLSETNVASRFIRESRRVLIYGACVRDEYPEIYEEFSRGRVPLAVCLEAEHFNIIALKVASMFARVDLEEVVVLTVDGSPHCVGLHHAVEEAIRVTGKKLLVKHYVIERGEAVEVSSEAVKAARYLSRVQRLMDEKTS